MISPVVAEVVVTATSTGTLQLQVSASANLEDLAGNALDTTSAILDDTTIMVEENTTVAAVVPITGVFAHNDEMVLGALEAAEAALPYPVLPVYVLLSESRAVDGGPAIVDEPAPSDGPHLWYAVQWFAFALITIGGFLAFARTQWRSPSERSAS